MNENERMKVGEYWLALAQMYGKDFSKMTLKISLDSVNDLNFQDVINFLSEWPKTTKSQRAPFPSEIRENILKKASVDSIANESATRIRLAIKKYGWPDPENARNYIGEIGWSVVERCGGWEYVCENHGVDLNPLTFHAQARDIAKAIIDLNSTGNLNNTPMLENKDVKMLDIKIKTIGEKK